MLETSRAGRKILALPEQRKDILAAKFRTRLSLHTSSSQGGAGGLRPHQMEVTP